MKRHLLFIATRLSQRLLLVLLLVGSVLFFQKSHAQTTFPYSNSLDGTNTAGLTLLGTNIQYKNGYLQLTPYSSGQAGFLYFDAASFPSNHGIHVEFEYTMQGARHDNSVGGDGLSFFLYDASKTINYTTPGTVGAPPTGASLGYSMGNAAGFPSGGVLTPGAPGGYLGLGFDAYGNFKTQQADRSGFPNSDSYFGSYPTNSFINHLTIRGAAGKDFSTHNPTSGVSSSANTNDDYWGYPILYTASGYDASTTPTIPYYGAYLKMDATSQGQVANQDAGSMLPNATDNKLYSYMTTPVNTIGSPIRLEGLNGSGTSTPTWNPSDPDYRKAFVDIWPKTVNGQSGYSITVVVQQQNTRFPLATDFFIPSGELKYIDNGGIFMDASNNRIPKIATLDATAPANFKFGFAGSTGANMDMIAIHNLYVSIPGSAVANPDYASGCLNGGAVTIANVFDNDISYDNDSHAITGSAQIDKNSFRFNSDFSTVASTGTGMGQQSIVTNGDGSTTVTYKNQAGTWVYTSSAQGVIYTRSSSFKGVAKALYSIYGTASQVNNDNYRSSGGSLQIGLTGPYVNNDTTTWSPTTSASISMLVLSNDTSFVFNPSTGTLVTSGASPINKNSFYFTSADGASNFGTTYSATETTGGTWTYDAATGKVTFTLTNYNYQGTFRVYYRIKTQDGCLSDVDTVVLNLPFALPITLSSFGVTRVNTTALLQWTTSSEINNAGFYIERSADASTWSSIGYVSSLAKGGNSSQDLNYDYSDKSPLAGLNYYRLKQVDIDGKTSYSDVRSVTFDASSSVILYPNPANQTIYIKNVIAGQQLRIISVDGKILKTVTINTTPQSVDIANLLPGLYFVQIWYGNKIIETVKFRKI